jgi:esterase
MELNYKSYGSEGEHLIILHGLFGSLDNWHTLATALGNTFRVWTIDQRNHGKSPHHHEFNYDVMAQDLLHFMEQHNIDAANIIGHSMGGKTAMQFALNYPEKVKKLVVVDIGPKGYKGNHNEIIDALLNLDLLKIQKRTDAEEMLAENIKEADVRQFLLKNLTRESSGYKWKMNLNDIVDNYEAIIGPIILDKKFTKPTLFIKGDRSDYILEEDKTLIKQQFTEAEFVNFPEVGHWVHAETPGLFLQATLEFLKK